MKLTKPVIGGIIVVAVLVVVVILMMSVPISLGNGDKEISDDLRAEAGRIAGAIDEALRYSDRDMETTIVSNNALEIDERNVIVESGSHREWAGFGDGKFYLVEGDVFACGPTQINLKVTRDLYYNQSKEALFYETRLEIEPGDDSRCESRMVLLRRQKEEAINLTEKKLDRTVFMEMIREKSQELIDAYDGQENLTAFVEGAVKEATLASVDEYANYIETTEGHDECTPDPKQYSLLQVNFMKEHVRVGLDEALSSDNTVSVWPLFSQYDVVCTDGESTYTYSLGTKEFTLDLSKIL